MNEPTKLPVLSVAPAVASCLASFLSLRWTLASWGPAATVAGSLPLLLFLAGLCLGVWSATLFGPARRKLRALADCQFSLAWARAMGRALVNAVLWAVILAGLFLAAVL
jgi:hypothetical protein